MGFGFSTGLPKIYHAAPPAARMERGAMMRVKTMA
jgi:hypothetical protein